MATRAAKDSCQRFRHRPTRFLCEPTSRAISSLSAPENAIKITLARCTNRCMVVRLDFLIRSRMTRCFSVIVTLAALPDMPSSCLKTET